MTVKELLDVFDKIEVITFFYVGGFETIDTNTEGSFKAIKKYFDSNVLRTTAVGHHEIRIVVKN